MTARKFFLADSATQFDPHPRSSNLVAVAVDEHGDRIKSSARPVRKGHRPAHGRIIWMRHPEASAFGGSTKHPGQGSQLSTAGRDRGDRDQIRVAAGKT